MEIPQLLVYLCLSVYGESSIIWMCTVMMQFIWMFLTAFQNRIVNEKHFFAADFNFWPIDVNKCRHQTGIGNEATMVTPKSHYWPSSSHRNHVQFKWMVSRHTLLLKTLHLNSNNRPQSQQRRKLTTQRIGIQLPTTTTTKTPFALAKSELIRSAGYVEWTMASKPVADSNNNISINKRRLKD